MVHFTSCSHLQYSTVANELVKAGEAEKAEEVLESRDYVQE